MLSHSTGEKAALPICSNQPQFETHLNWLRNWSEYYSRGTYNSAETLKMFSS